MRNTIFVVVGFIIIIGIGAWILPGRSIAPVERETLETLDAGLPPAIAPAQPESLRESSDDDALEDKIVYENGAFSPAIITIKAGGTLTFENKHVSDIRIASNPHPLHSSYPGLESGVVGPGQKKTITLTESAKIFYHNHFNPSAQGQIVVE